jgi:hypothetical protein
VLWAAADLAGKAHFGPLPAELGLIREPSKLHTPLTARRLTDVLPRQYRVRAPIRRGHDLEQALTAEGRRGGLRPDDEARIAAERCQVQALLEAIALNPAQHQVVADPRCIELSFELGAARDFGFVEEAALSIEKEHAEPAAGFAGASDDRCQRYTVAKCHSLPRPSPFEHPKRLGWRRVRSIEREHVDVCRSDRQRRPQRHHARPDV